MSEPLPNGWHWRCSAALNACLGGDPSEPLCSRAWRGQWALFIEAMGWLFDDVCHCEDVNARWLTETASRAPGQLPCQPDGDRCGG